LPLGRLVDRMVLAGWVRLQNNVFFSQLQYIYENSFLLPLIVTPICISLDLGRIWPDEVYVDEVYDRTKLFMIIYMSSIQEYIEFIVILILYSTVVVF
jgi:hypothetical protein